MTTDERIRYWRNLATYKYLTKNANVFGMEKDLSNARMTVNKFMYGDEFGPKKDRIKITLPVWVDED